MSRWRAIEAPDSGPWALIPLNLSEQRDHAFLSASDRCSYLLEYAPGTGPRLAAGRQMIRDYKSVRSAVCQQRAILTLARMLRAAVSATAAQQATWVPIPPSRVPRDAGFDDRLMRTLRLAFQGYDVDLRPLLYQAHSTPADHLCRRRLTAAALLENLHVDAASLRLRPLRARINLFDDVLTTGKHYRYCEQRLREVLPDTPICGVFLLRRILPRRWRGP